MRTRMRRFVVGVFASLSLVLALSASQPSAVCAAENTVLKCDGDRCCTVTKDTSGHCQRKVRRSEFSTGGSERRLSPRKAWPQPCSQHVSPIKWDNVILYGQYVLDRARVR